MTETTKRTTKVWAHRGASGYRQEIDQIHQLKLEKLSVLAENHATPEQMEKVASNISLWGEIDFEEKRFTVDKMIRSLKVFPGSVQIQWKF